MSTVKGIVLGLLIAAGIVTVFELAGGDATLVVMLVLLTTYVGVRLNRVEDLFEQMVEEIREAQAECGDVFPGLVAGDRKVCIRKAGHADQWHASTDGVQWLHTIGGGGGGSRLGDTQPTP